MKIAINRKDMSKREARKHLEKWLNYKAIYRDVKLPIVDEVVVKKGFCEWTFIGLMKIAYDLK
jgi:hypothetical protein